MRVISGSARGRKLKKVPGETTRPIMDRVKESLFNILGQSVLDTRWLDLFAGTGQVGIEALSRGAAEVVFTDNARPAIKTIHENLRITQLSGQAQVLSVDAFAYLRGFGDRPFDIIYVAPPQYKEMWVEVMKLLDERPARFLTATGLIIVQIDPKESRALLLKKLNLTDQRRYGNTELDFYEQRSG
jgi:16S rRNA (guanine(966)-N(2))-methyltransferase RsmD